MKLARVSETVCADGCGNRKDFNALPVPTDDHVLPTTRNGKRDRFPTFRQTLGLHPAFASEPRNRLSSPKNRGRGC